MGLHLHLHISAALRAQMQQDSAVCSSDLKRVLCLTESPDLRNPSADHHLRNLRDTKLHPDQLSGTNLPVARPRRKEEREPGAGPLLAEVIYFI